jgi:hypothetical protein
MFASLFSFRSKATPRLDVKSIDLTQLTDYMAKKRNYKEKIDFATHFKTSLDVGKYSLVLLVKKTLLEQIVKPGVDYEMIKQNRNIISDDMIKPDVDYEKIKKDLFIFSKINEFLEQPDAYDDIGISIETEFTNRKSIGLFLKICEEKSVDVRKHSIREMNRLFLKFTIMFHSIDPPPDLPVYLKTGSGYGQCSKLHLVIKNLYQQIYIRSMMLKKTTESKNFDLD